MPSCSGGKPVWFGLSILNAGDKQTREKEKEEEREARR